MRLSAPLCITWCCSSESYVWLIKWPRRKLVRSLHFKERACPPQFVENVICGKSSPVNGHL